MSNFNVHEENLTWIMVTWDRLQYAYINKLRLALGTASQSRDRYGPESRVCQETISRVRYTIILGRGTDEINDVDGECFQ